MLTPHLRAFVRSAHRAPPHTRPISTGQPRTLKFPTPPPARRHFERPPSSTPVLGSTSATNKTVPNKTTATRAGTIHRRLTNRQIPFDQVFVLDPDTNKLSPTKRNLDALLLETQQQSRRGLVVELITSTPEPIVRVAIRSELEARYREMKRALRKGAREGEEAKEVQLTWGVGRADLEHKLRKAGRDLEKGYRVVVVITIKRGHRPSSRQEWVAFADEISQMLGKAGEEWKEREVTERTMVMSFRRTKRAGGDDDVP